jgi:predicted permease
LDGAPARIIGVLPESFELPTLQHADLLAPQITSPAGWQHGATRVLRVLGRLKEGVSLKAARAELAPFFNGTLAYVPPRFRKEVQFRVRSIRDRQMGWAQAAAWTLLGAVLAVLLISCANVANLLLARAAGRERELAIRNALGISRARLLGQMLTESLLLALVGGAIGCGLGAGLLRLAIAADPSAIPHLADATLDLRVLAMSFALSLAAGLTFGLAPAFHTGRGLAMSGSRTATPRASSRLKNSLIAGQIAVSLVLVAAAGLLVRSLWNLETQPLGMSTGHVLTAQFVLPSSRYRKPEERVAFFNEVEQRLETIPGIRFVGLSDSLPPAGWERSRPLSSIQIVGGEVQRGGSGGLVEWRYVSPGYFEALRIPVVEGRAVQETDRERGVNLCILSRSLARRLFPGQNPVGQRLKIGADSPVEIVAVVPDVKNTGLSVSGNPEYYIMRTHVPDDVYVNGTGPVAQRTLSIVLRSDIPDATLSAMIRRQIAGLDATLPVEIQSMHQRLGELAAGPRFNTLVLLTFAGVGLLLAAIGLYGTIAYLVNQRTQEIGIRMSVGARPIEIARLLLSYSAKWTAIGAVAGMLVSIGTTRLLSSLLFRVSPRDPITLITAIVCLFLVAILATIMPIRRAARVDPAIALKSN